MPGSEASGDLCHCGMDGQRMDPGKGTLLGALDGATMRTGAMQAPGMKAGNEMRIGTM